MANDIALYRDGRAAERAGKAALASVCKREADKLLLSILFA